MRRDAGASEGRRIRRRIYDHEDGEGIIGSRVLPPLRAPPAPMPSVRTRRSTRVFVPKAAVAKLHPAAEADGGAADPARILRSGKRLAASNPLGTRASSEKGEWSKGFGRSGGGGGGATDLRWWDRAVNAGWRHADEAERSPAAEEEEEEEEMSRDPFDGKTFVVYKRKRRSPRSRNTTIDRMYGIVFSRNKQRKKPKLAPLAETRTKAKEVNSRELKQKFQEKVRALDGDRWVGCGQQLVLAVLVETSCYGSSVKFARFLASILSWMRTARAGLSKLTTFLLSGSITGVLALHGMNFVPLKQQKDNVFSIDSCGHCILYGARQFVPLLWVDYSALSVYFMGLHLGIAFRSMYFSHVRYVGNLVDDSLALVVRYKQHKPSVSMETDSGAEFEVPVTLAVSHGKKDDLSGFINTPEPLQRKAFLQQSMKSRKNHRKRAYVRHAGLRSTPLLNSVEPVTVKLLGSHRSDFFSLRAELNDISSPLGAYYRHKKSARKSPVERIKELKAALAEVKQNIDSVHCNANILVTDTDRCWRIEGAEVTLGSTGPNDWCIMVRAQGSTSYLHTPHEMRPSVVNRYTHAYMWTGGDDWKLEFCDRWDWLVFKELHAECRARNVQDAPASVIPIPGVQEVSSYNDDSAASFMRPETYIRVAKNEVERTLMSNVAYYDMDSGDEEWLNNLNASSFGKESSTAILLSEENFEKIIFSLEKDAFCHPNEVSDKERALDLCGKLGKGDMVATVFDYWLNKRSNKHAGNAPLVKVFQGQSLKRPQLITKPFLRKKRSFKRQRSSQVGRGKLGAFLQAGEDEAATRRVQEAESAAKRAMESAIRLRSRAQMVMENAELAVYRSVMALKVAAALQASDSPDLASSVLE